MDLTKTFVYRITHIDNISHVLRYGITHRNSPNSNPDYRAIGDASLIDTRSHRHVRVNNGRINSPHRTILLGDFIPFYFGVRMPMLYVIQRGGNFVPEAVTPSEIVYMACPISMLVERQSEYYYTNGHATESCTSIFDSSCMDDLATNVDWSAVRTRYWGGSDNLMVKARKQAEFLVRDDVSPECITSFACYDRTAKRKLIRMGIDESRIKVLPEAYY